MAWNYRVIRTNGAGGPWYAIHEVYYGEDGKLGATENPAGLARLGPVKSRCCGFSRSSFRIRGSVGEVRGDARGLQTAS
jgi:hypothetical protein